MSGYLPPSRAGSRGGPPGTARPGSRLGTGRPGSSLGSAVQQAGVGAPMDVQVTDRPLTRSGIQGMPSSYGGQRRTVQDHTFYANMVHGKIKELQQEIKRCEEEITRIDKDTKHHKALQNRYQTLESTVRELEGNLADHNLARDKHRSGKRPTDFAQGMEPVQHSIYELKQRLDAIFLERKKYEDGLAELEKEGEKLRARQEEAIEDLTPAQRQHYMERLRRNDELKQEVASMQHRVFHMAGEVAKYQQELQQETGRRQYSLLENQLRRLEKKRDELLEEKRMADLDPKQMHRMLLERVREDTALIKEGKGKMATVTAENEALAQKLTNTIQQLEARRKSGEEVAEAAAEQAKKIQQLQARDQHMQNFISSFPDEEASWKDKKEQASRVVVALLEHISENISRSQNLPSRGRVEEMKQELDFKDQQLNASKSTMHSLQSQLEVRKEELKKLEGLDGRIDGEIAAIRERLQRLEAETERFKDVDGLKQEHNELMNWLQDALRTHTLRGQSGEFLAREATRLYETSKLSEPELDVMKDVLKLEDRHQKLAQQEFELIIESRAADTFYEPLRDRCSSQLEELSRLHAANAARM